MTIIIQKHYTAYKEKNPPLCENCIWSIIFNKRPDEPSNMGCRKPGWEGYTINESPACGGLFFTEKINTGVL